MTSAEPDPGAPGKKYLADELSENHKFARIEKKRESLIAKRESLIAKQHEKKKRDSLQKKRSSGRSSGHEHHHHDGGEERKEGRDSQQRRGSKPGEHPVLRERRNSKTKIEERPSQHHHHHKDGEHHHHKDGEHHHHHRKDSVDRPSLKERASGREERPSLKKKQSKPRGQGLASDEERKNALHHYQEHIKMREATPKPSKPARTSSSSKVAPVGDAPAPPRATPAAAKEADWRMERQVIRYRTAGCFGKTHAFAIDAGLAALAHNVLNVPDAQMRRLHNVFAKNMGAHDADEEMSTSEFFELLDLDPTPFLRSLLDGIIFDWADLNNDKKLSFSEFFLAACVVCGLEKRQLVYFVFALFDADDDGRLDIRELEQISAAVQGSRFGGTNANFLEICDSMTSHHSLDKSLMSFDGFLAAVDKAPHVLHPALQLQERFVAKTLGAAAWKRIFHAYEAEVGDSFHAVMRDAGLHLLGESQLHGGVHGDGV